MNYLIDGHNLIAKLKSISLDDPNDEAKLIIQLRRWTAASRGRRITLFFDGGLPGGLASSLSSSRVSVVFASAGSTADELIINRMKKINNSQEYVLVSSDGEVKSAATMKNVRTISAQAFAAQVDQLDQPQNDENDLGSNKAENPSLNDHEIDEWLEIFNRGNENSL